MRDAFRDLIEFEHACGHELAATGPAIPDARTRQLRRDLIREEQGELDAAIVAGDLGEIADGIADLIYVALGTAVRFGIDIVPIWDQVHAANMRKFGPGSQRHPKTGKLMKPPGWQHPDIAGMIAKQLPLQSLYEPENPKEDAA